MTTKIFLKFTETTNCTRINEKAASIRTLQDSFMNSFCIFHCHDTSFLRNLLWLLRLLCFEHLGHNFLFFNQEGPDDPVPDTFATTGTSVSPCDGLVALAECRELPGPCRRYATQLQLAVTTFRDTSWLLQVEVHQLATGSLGDSPSVGVGVVRQASPEG